MKRTFSQEEWDARGRAMEDLARRIGLVQRRPLDEQPLKSRVKSALLKRLYGPTGQA